MHIIVHIEKRFAAFVTPKVPIEAVMLVVRQNKVLVVSTFLFMFIYHRHYSSVTCQDVPVYR